MVRSVTTLDASVALMEPEPEPGVGISDPGLGISRQPVIAMLEALVGPDGAAVTLRAAGIPAWATVGELSEAESERLRLEVVRRCAVRPAAAGDEDGG